jgi:small GTP-binding protein
MESKGIKIILVGESGVGKTNLISVSMGKNFMENSGSTMASSFYEGEVEYNNKKYLYCLWDTAGQEKFRALNKIFMKNAKIVMIVFSIDSENSFKEVDFWVNYTKEILGNDQYIMALIANKSDLYEKQAMSDQAIEEKAKNLKIKYKVTSALTDAAGFKLFLNELIVDYINLIGPEGEKGLTFTLCKQPQEVKKKKKC